MDGILQIIKGMAGRGTPHAKKDRRVKLSSMVFGWRRNLSRNLTQNASRSKVGGNSRLLDL
jgi:hypothetical protein